MTAVDTPSLMLKEAGQAPAATATLLAAEAHTFAGLGEDLRRHPPQSLLTVARGSSDHAAHYLAYLVMARLGRLVTSLPMSLITLHQSKLHCQGLVALAFSQSGQSPDLIEPLQMLGRQGARTLALVNDTASPLALVAQRVVPLHAGAERSVAATKSFICQLAAGAALVAAWQDGGQALRPHGSLTDALAALPDALQLAWCADPAWDAAVSALIDAERLYVVGRGTGLAVAMEVALKLKEVCGIQAEAFSGAEVQHGPMALVGPGFPMLVLAPEGPAQAGLLILTAQMIERGARVLLAAPPGAGASIHPAVIHLPLTATPHAELQPLAIAQRFYRWLETLARARGLDPDHPRHLHKVTRTH